MLDCTHTTHTCTKAYVQTHVRTHTHMHTHKLKLAEECRSVVADKKALECELEEQSMINMTAQYQIDMSMGLHWHTSHLVGVSLLK